MPSRAHIIQHAMQRANDAAHGLLMSHPLFRLLHMVLRLYTGLLELMRKVKMLRQGVKPLNELQLEGLHRKRVEIFFFDFYTKSDLDELKSKFRSITTAIVLTLGQYALCSYFLKMSLINRLLMTCSTSTLLIMLLTFWKPVRAVTLITLPSMAQGNVKTIMLLAAIVLIGAGPIVNIRANSNSLTAVQSCLSDEFFDITGRVRQLANVGAKTYLRFAIVAIELAVESVHRLIFTIATFIRRLIKYLLNKFKFIRRFTNKIVKYFSFGGGCRRLFLVLQRKFRHQKVLGGLVQGIFKLFGSVTGTELAKPTLGHMAHQYGYSRVCPLLDKINKFIRKVKTELKDLIKKAMKVIAKIVALIKLLIDLTSPKAAITVRRTGSFGHQLYQLRRQLIQAVLNKTISLQYFQSISSRIVQYVSSSVSVIVFVITIVLAIKFYTKFMASDEFENIYVTAPFVRLDEIEPPLLPLDDFERVRISVLSEELISNIGSQLKPRVIIFALIRILPVIIILAVEYYFYLAVSFIESVMNGVIEIERQMEPGVSLNTSFDESPFSILAQVFILIQRSLKVLHFDVNLLVCTPAAEKPNFLLDAIVTLMCIAYIILTAFQPYFIKIRHQILINMYPDRAVQRAVWLRRKIEAERQLLPEEKRAITEQHQDENANLIQSVYKQYVTDNFSEWSDTIRQLFNLPTVHCAACGVRGNISIRSFSELFVMCDACEQYLCVRCVHGLDEAEGVVKMLKNCPVCAGELQQYNFDAHELNDKDPLNELLDAKLNLGPEYRVGPRALELQAAEAEEFRRQAELDKKLSVMNALSMDQHGGDDNDERNEGQDLEEDGEEDGEEDEEEDGEEDGEDKEKNEVEKSALV